MNSIRILIVLVIILGLIIFSQRIANQSKKSSPTPTTTPFPTVNPTTTPTSNSTNSPTTILSPTTIQPITSTPTSTPSNQTLNITDFKYPNSTIVIVNQNGNKLELESTDDPKKITDWYKEKIKAMDMNVTSFVQTSTNGIVLNKLVGANGDVEIRIEITKQNNSKVVKISTSLIS